MSVPTEAPISFTNVGRSRWWQRGIFYQIYPLKAFNYLLIIMPPVAMLAGRG